MPDPSNKYKSIRYKRFMNSMQSYFSSANDSYYSSLKLGGELSTKDDVKQMTTDELIKNFAFYIDQLTRNNHMANEVSGTITLSEEKINQIKEEITSRFEAYKVKHDSFNDAEYRKFNFMENVIKYYNDGMEKLNNMEMPYSNSADTKELNDSINDLEKKEEVFNEQVNHMDELIHSSTFDVDGVKKYYGNILSDEVISSKNLATLDYGKTNVSIATAIQNARDEYDKTAKRINDEIQNLRNERKTKLENITNEYEKKKKDQQAKFEKRYKDIQDEIFRINDALNGQTVEEANEDAKEYSSKLKDEKFKTITSEFQVVNGENWEDSLDDLLEENLLALKSNVIDKKKLLTEQQDQLDILIVEKKKDIEAAEKDYNDTKAHEEELSNSPNSLYGVRKKHLENQQKDFDEINELYNTVKEKGADAVDQELLKKWGANFKNVNASEQMKTANSSIEAFNKAYNQRGYFGLGSSPSENFAKSLKNLKKSLVDNFGHYWNENAKYEEAHKGEPAFKLADNMNSAKNDFNKLMESLESFDGKLTLKSADAINKLLKFKLAMEQTVASIKSDAPKEIKKLGADITAVTKAMESLTLNPDANIALMEVANVANQFGTETNVANMVLHALEPKLNLEKERLERDKSGFEEEVNRQKLALENKQGAIDTQKKMLSDLEAQKGPFETTKEYLDNCEKLIDTKLSVKKIGIDREQLKNDLDIKTKELNSMEGIHSSDLEKIENEYKTDIETCKEEYKKDILKKAKNGVTDLEEAKHVKESSEQFGYKLSAILSEKSKLIDAAKKVSDVTTSYIGHHNAAILTVLEEKETALASLDMAEDDAINSLKNSKKSGITGNTKEFKDMISALEAYMTARNQQNKKEVSSEQFAQIRDTAFVQVKAYIAARNNGGKIKGTSHGQFRLDKAKQIVEMLNRRDDVIKMYDQEKQEIQSKIDNRPEILPCSSIDKEIISSATTNCRFVDGFKNEQSQKTYISGENVKDNFKTILDATNGRDTLLGRIVNSGIEGLKNNNAKAFNIGIAAAIVAHDKIYQMHIDEKDAIKKENKIKTLVAYYAKSPTVQSLTAELIKGTKNAEEALETIKSHDFKEQCMEDVNKAVEKRKVEANKSVETAEYGMGAM